MPRRWHVRRRFSMTVRGMVPFQSRERDGSRESRRRQSGSADACDPEGVHAAVVIADRDVFSFHELVSLELEPDLVVLARSVVVVDDPCRTPRPSGAVHKPSAALRRAGPDAANAAPVADLPPARRIKLAFRVERRGDLVAMSVAAVGIVVTTGEPQRDVVKHVQSEPPKAELGRAVRQVMEPIMVGIAFIDVDLAQGVSGHVRRDSVPLRSIDLARGASRVRRRTGPRWKEDDLIACAQILPDGSE